jgi:opacity protein-like surface antigen
MSRKTARTKKQFIMKKLIFAGVFFLAAFSLKAQTSSGDLFVGGGFQFTTSGGEVTNGATTTQKANTFSLGFTPKVGYFVSDKLAVGAGIGYVSSRTTQPNDDYTASSTISFSPFARVYMPANEQINFYGQGSVGIGIGNSKQVVGATETDTGDITTFNFGAGVGVAFFPSEHINIGFGFNLINFRAENDTDPNNDVEDKTNTFNFGLSTFSPSIGINYFF